MEEALTQMEHRNACDALRLLARTIHNQHVKHWGLEESKGALAGNWPHAQDGKVRADSWAQARDLCVALLTYIEADKPWGPHEDIPLRELQPDIYGDEEEAE